MLYEIISPNAFLRPFIADYTTLSSIYAVVRNAYAKNVYVDRAFQKKTNELVQRHIDTNQIASVGSFTEIGSDTIELIKRRKGGDGTKVINLIKSIEKTAEENSEDPFLIALAERAKTVQENYEDRQTATSEALTELLMAVQQDVERKREQAARGLDSASYFVLCKLNDENVKNADAACKKFGRHSFNFRTGVAARMSCDSYARR
jgi:type I restriction enzyme R subunit